MTGVFRSPTLAQDAKFTHRFNAPGTFNYYCEIHTFMQASVTVAQ
jgi:plastocyanin